MNFMSHFQNLLKTTANLALTVTAGLILLLGLNSCYQWHEPPPEAEKEYNAAHPFENQILTFKYGLYPELMALANPFDFEDPAFHKISQKVADFAATHGEALRDYQRFHLIRLNRNEINLSDFESFPVETLERPPVPFPLVFLLDPGAQMMGQIPIYLLQKTAFSHQSMAQFYFQMGVGGLKTQSKPLDADHWEVVIDAYSRAFRFHFSLKTGMAHLVALYQRKSSGSATPPSGDTP